mgnify:CR=1 FL=1
MKTTETVELKSLHKKRDRQVTISEFDYPRLKELLIDARQGSDDPPLYISDLESELQRASIVPPEQIPPYVVTMNTQVGLTNNKSGKRATFTIVFPANANSDDGKLSIFSELGTAILGYTVGDTIEFDSPDGHESHRINMICFQPEAAKQFDL